MPPDNEDGLIKFRVTQLENLIGEVVQRIESKVDQLLTLQSKANTSIALEAQRREQLEKEVERLEKKVDQTFVVVTKEVDEVQKKVETQSEHLTKIRITFAEKFAPGAISGGGAAAVVTAAVYLVQYLIG